MAVNLYMPAYMAREFGHAAGLWHNESAAVDNAMIAEMSSSVLDVTNDDKEAMKSIYNDHTAHRRMTP